MDRLLTRLGLRLRRVAATRGAHALLFAALLLRVAAPAFHVEPDGHALDPGGEATAHGAPCSGLFHAPPAEPTLAASCPAGDDCRDPWHHHHATHPHDLAHCGACLSLLHAHGELPEAPPSAQPTCLGVRELSPRAPPVAWRANFSLARGPPADVLRPSSHRARC